MNSIVSYQACYLILSTIALYRKCVSAPDTSLPWMHKHIFFLSKKKKKDLSSFSSTLSFSVNRRKIGWISAVSLGQSGECDHKCPWIAPSGNLCFFYFCPGDLYLTVLSHTLCLLVLSFFMSEKMLKFSVIAHWKIHCFLLEKPLTFSCTGVASFFFFLKNNHN